MPRKDKLARHPGKFPLKSSCEATGVPELRIVPGEDRSGVALACVNSACAGRRAYCFRKERKISAERLDFISGAERLSSRSNRTQANPNAAGNEMEPRNGTHEDQPLYRPQRRARRDGDRPGTRYLTRRRQPGS